jgi:pyruvate kinase
VKRRPRTRIVCTIGPATGTPARIERLVREGMSVARLNLSHGSREDHEGYVRSVRQVSERLGVAIGILADLPGPKYRVGEMTEQGVRVRAGEPFTLFAKVTHGTRDGVNVWPVGLHKDVKKGAKVLLDEGAVELRVQEIAGQDIHCRITQGGVLKDNKAVTAPGHTSTLEYFTDETTEALNFAISADVDFIGLSYIRDANDLVQVRKKVQAAGKRCQLVSKIEIKQAVENLLSIIDESDAVMVARGDLGVELPIEHVPGVQKRIIRRANERGKPVITATQMLESMIEGTHPTRAEASDVHNAVRDGTDAIMLSGETSIGRNPFKVVNYMSKIAKRAEKFLDYEALGHRRLDFVMKTAHTVDDAIAHSATVTAAALGAKVILAFTESGSTAARVASYRPVTPVLALSKDTGVGNRLSLRWGVAPVRVYDFEFVQNMFFEGSKLAAETGYTKDGDIIVAVVGMPIGQPGNTNLLRIITTPEPEPVIQRRG